MFKNSGKTLTAGFASLALAASVVSFGAAPAQAEECVGRNDREMLTDIQWTTHMDSCAARDLVNSYGDVKDAVGLATMIGAKWPQVAWIGIPFFAWAWINQSQVRGCEEAHTGITFEEINGIVVSCSPQ